MGKYEKDNDLKFMKDLISEERIKRERQFEDQYKLYIQMQ